MNIKDPKPAEEYYNRGNELSKLSRFQEAIVCYDKALEVNPKYAQAWYNKGSAFLQL